MFSRQTVSSIFHSMKRQQDVFLNLEAAEWKLQMMKERKRTKSGKAIVRVCGWDVDGMYFQSR